MSAAKKRAWSPYVLGAGIGVLSWCAFATANHQIGITSAFENTAALATKVASPASAAANPIFTDKAREGKVARIGWEWMLVGGALFGAASERKHPKELDAAH